MLFVFLLAAQAAPEVASIQRHEQKWRVSLKGELDAPDGTSLVVTVLPIEYRLAADGRRLVRVASESGAAFCRAQVAKRAFTATFAASRLGEQEVRFGGATTQLLLFDRASCESRRAHELKLFAQHVKTLRDFVSELEPYAKAGSLVPKKMLRRLGRIEDPIRLWAESTDVAAAAAVLSALLTELGTSVPWDGHDDPSALDGTDYPRTEKRQSRPFDIAEYRARIDLARGTALRECYLRLLVPLEQARDVASVQALRATFNCLGTGELADLHAGASKNLGELLAQCEDAARGRAVKDLAERLRTAREAVEAGQKGVLP